MRVLLTGGCGFIGSHVFDLLIEDGHQVHVVDNTGDEERIRFVQARTPMLSKIDIGVWPALLEYIFDSFQPEVVIHLAAQASIASSELEPRHDLTTNGIGTINVLRAAKKVGVRRFVFASTSAVYADSAKRALAEGGRVNPSSPYGISKLAAEWYIRWMFPNTHVILRLGNVYGPRQVPIGENQLLARLIHHFRDQAPFVIHGDGRQERDFVYVEDVARAFMMGMTGKSGTYNISFGAPFSVNEAAILMAQCWGHPSYIFRHDKEQDPRRRVWLDVGQAQTMLGWTAEVGLEDGIQKTIDWWNGQ